MLDWLFDPRCISCDAAATTICDDCRLSLVPLGPACPRCAEPTGERACVCRRCSTTPLPVESIAAPWQWGGQLEVAIKRLKFASHPYVARSLAPLWAPMIAAAVADHDAVVVPVALHWWRRFTRGYDNVWLLALHACRAAGVAPPIPALRRIRRAPPQSKLTAAARRANLRGAFVARDRRIVGRAVVLLDDVVTTGATVAAAARALLDGGATRVTAVALARASSG